MHECWRVIIKIDIQFDAWSHLERADDRLDGFEVAVERVLLVQFGLVDFDQSLGCVAVLHHQAHSLQSAR